MDNDVFIGTRLAFNDVQDTSVLAGAVVDIDTQERFFNLEAERRLGENYVLEARLRIFDGDRQVNQLFSVDRDDYLQIKLVRYF